MDPTAASADNLTKPPAEGEVPAETASAPAPALAGGKASGLVALVFDVAFDYFYRQQAVGEIFRQT
jgi:hypothetical protein